MLSRILIVDDELYIRESLSDVLSTTDYKIELASSAEEAIRIMSEASRPFNLVLSDLRMPGMDGTKLLDWIKKRYPRTDVIIFTAYGSIETAVSAIKNGASDYITKPLDMTRLQVTVQNVLERQRLLAENQALKNRLKNDTKELIFGNSHQIVEIYEIVKRVADTDATVLIEGESGTGKEVVARSIHTFSSRREKPFVVINCAALPTTLLENELFGHEREAFTGAASLKKGRFEQANGGTIFLDEITEMSLESQSGFLRVLEDGCFHRVGGSSMIQVDIRIIAASNRKLLKACEDGRFRYDLYYRLNVVPIHMPLLKERKDDIPILVQSFIDEFTQKYNRPNLEIPPEVIKALQEYDWPGNVRELRNALERAVILTKGDTIQLDHFPKLIQESVAPPQIPTVKPGISIMEMEKQLIQQTLNSVAGHRKKAAGLLGISIRALQYKIKQYEI